MNPLPAGLDVDALNETISSQLPDWRPELTLLNGFCMLVRRAVFNAIGGFDEENFPHGYGEENDFCIRARNAGFLLSCTLDCFVFHEKSRSYGHEERNRLSERGGQALERKHGRLLIKHTVNCLEADPLLAEARRIAARICEAKTQPTLLFLLPLPPGGGGAHSVVQEVEGMRRLGVDAQIECRPQDVSVYRSSYPTVDPRAFAPKSMRFDRDIVVATLYQTVEDLLERVSFDRRVMPAYYVQDYEPWFFPPGSLEWQMAVQSYGRVRGMVHFAKTQWLCELVERNHSVDVAKVSASVDHSVYYPRRRERRARKTVTAMLRPSTPRRAPARTLRVLEELLKSRAVDVLVFGASNIELRAHGFSLPHGVKNLGVLSREEVAASLAHTDVFLDLSDYQAFGRTGLEAMACGAIPVLPALGGASDYVIDGVNGRLVDTSSELECLAVANELLSLSEQLFDGLRKNAIGTAIRYTKESAARSEIKLLKARWDGRRDR
ncbi:MAG: glycosyltransferase [Myxococcota bacterium]